MLHFFLKVLQSQEDGQQVEYLAQPSSLFLYHNKFVGAFIDFLVGSSDEVIDPCLTFARRCFSQDSSLFLQNFAMEALAPTLGI